MHNKQIRNKLKLCLGMLLCAVAILFTPMSTITSYASTTEDASTYENYRQWVYKIMDGKLYKALLNNSTGRYETDWIYVCEWPPEE